MFFSPGCTYSASTSFSHFSGKFESCAEHIIRLAETSEIWRAKTSFYQSPASLCIGKTNISQKQIPYSLNNLSRSYFFVHKFGTRRFSCFIKSKLVPGRQLLLFFPFSLHFPNFPLSILMAAQCIKRGTLQQQSPHTKTHRGFSGAIVSCLGILPQNICCWHYGPKEMGKGGSLTMLSFWS